MHFPEISIFSFLPLDVSPMTSRNFPASFWNSHYQPPAAPSSLASLSHQPDFLTDHYMTSSLHLQSPAAVDPWRYSCTLAACSTSGPAGGYAGHPAAATGSPFQDFSYPPMHASSRFNAYSSFLPTASSRLTSGTGQCDAFTKAESWSTAGRYAAGSAADALSVGGLGSAPHPHDSALHPSSLSGESTYSIYMRPVRHIYLRL